MRIHDMFAKDIDRSINGVVKVTQDDEASIRQELEEYVITRELRGHFATLLSRYADCLDTPTDKIGVWISGFFGSGKSHFLKMMSYLLSNQVVAGKPAIDYFEGKFDDPLMAAQARRCTSVPCESILFNIDNKGPQEKDKTAILKVFARVFYEHLGYYGEDMRLVRLEQAIDLKGKREEFRAEYSRITGQDWLDTRDSYDFFQDDVIAALEASGVMSAEAATRWFDGSQSVAFSIDSLVSDISAYVEQRRAESPQGLFRLLFMVDEVGQYIGADVNLMLNLQTIVEELGARCGGSVWVMVTSQEAIDEITQVAGNDFSKIQGRFNTRLSLSSSSVDEVIKARVLAKTPQASSLLQSVYATNAAAMRSLFAFQDSRGDLQGFADEGDFTSTFPFVGYQFKVMQDVLTQLRTHGSSGKHLSGGERSMLSGFQEAAQAVSQGDECALVPFWRFYDTLSTFLEGYIRRVIERCAQAAADGDKGLVPQDVEVLKLLFLIRHVGDLKANLDNLTILMADRIDVDVVALRARIKDSLDRLLRQNYIARTGEVYTFLNDEEQDIAREISQQQVAPDQVRRELSNAVFADILDDLKKVRGGERDYPVDCYLDEQAYGSLQNGLPLRVVTPDWQGGLEYSGEGYALASAQPPQVLVVLDEGGPYYATAARVLKIERYVAGKSGVMASLPETTRSIIAARQEEKRGLQKEVKRMLEACMAKARVYVAGREVVEGRSDSAKKRVQYALEQLVDSVYNERDLVERHVQTDVQLRGILLGDAALEGVGSNERACQRMENRLRMCAASRTTVTMKDLQDLYQARPFGWAEMDVAAVAAQLVCDQKARVSVAGAAMGPKDPKLPEYLHVRTQVGKAVIEARQSVPAGTLNAARALLRELASKQDIPQDEDGLVEAVRIWLDGEVSQLEALLTARYARPGYPGKPAVEAMRDICRQVRGAYGEPGAFLRAFTGADKELEDAQEDLADVLTFFAKQIDQFDDARRELAAMDSERVYLQGSPEALQALAGLEEILSSERPYGRICELAPLVNKVRAAHNAAVGEKRRTILDEVEQAKQGVERYADEKEGVAQEGAKQALAKMETRWVDLRSQANAATTCMALDALRTRLTEERNCAFAEIDAAADRAEAGRRAREQAQARMAAEQQRIKDGGAAGEARVATSHVRPAAGTSAPGVTTTVGSSQASPKPAPAPTTRNVLSSSVLEPRRLTSEAEIDSYIAELSVKLKRRLRDAHEHGEDAIRLV